MLLKTNDGTTAVQDHVSDEMWFSKSLMNPTTLYFPPAMERVFILEHIGSDESRRNMRVNASIAFIFYIFAELFGLYSWITGDRSAVHTLSMILEFVAFIICEILALWVVIFPTRTQEQWRQWHEGNGSIHFRRPQVCIMAISALFLLRSENILYPKDFAAWQVSTAGFVFIIFAAAIGLSFKYYPSSVFTLVLFCVVVVRGIIVGALDRNRDSPVRLLVFLTPALISLLVNGWAMFVIETNFRTKYLTKKRLEIEMRRLKDRRVSVDSILQVVLPKDVIMRLQESDFQFSAVTDRFETAFCVFVDFYSSKEELDKISPENMLRLINLTFRDFDILLDKFQDVEKIKTISSKALLVAKPVGMDAIIINGDAITRLCIETLERMRAPVQIEFDDDGYGNDVQKVGDGCASVAGEYKVTTISRNVTIGIAFGEVVAGIVGVDRFVYDIYGDVVNTASRMQTLNDPKSHSVMCTAAAFAQFSPETRQHWYSTGMVSVKGKGIMEVYRLQEAPINTSPLLHFPALDVIGAAAPLLSVLDSQKKERISFRGNLPGVGEDAVRAILNTFHGHGNLSTVFDKSKTCAMAERQLGFGSALGSCERIDKDCMFLSKTKSEFKARENDHFSDIFVSEYGSGDIKIDFSRRPTSYDTTFSEATHKAVKSKRAQNGSYGYKGDPVLTVDERLSMARSFEKLASVKNSLLSLATPEIPMHLGTAGLEVRASVSTFEHPFYDERDLPLPPNIEVSEPLSPAVDLRRKSIAIRELRDSTSLKWLHEASKASLGKVSVGDEKRRRGVVEGADMFSNSWIPLYVLDHWQHIGKWSLLFLDSDMREKYRLFVRSDGGAYLKALFREGASAAIISSGIITIAILHTLFADDAGRMPSSVRLEYIAKNTVLRQYSPWIGIYSAVGFFTAQMFVCWLQHFLCRRRLDRIIRRVADETHTAVDTAALGSWGAYWLKIITTAGVIISIQLTTFGHVWLFPQAGMQLFLAFVANLEHQYLDSDMPFHYFMVAIVVMTVVPMTTLFFLKVAGMVDLIETFALTAIVLSGKYRHSLAKKTSFLFQLTLVTSRELQDLESAFFFELLGAILPHRVIESMFSDTRNESTLERFKGVSVIHLDITSFTVLSGFLRPHDVIKILNTLFTKFDRICYEHQVEKILTIGDAYVAMRAPESSNPKALEHKNNFRAEYMHKQKLKQDAEAIDGFDVKVNERPRASCHVNRSIMDMSFAKMTDSVLKTTEQLESIPAGGSEFQDYHSEAAVDACHAALEMLEAVENLASSWSESHADPSGKREEVNFQGRANLAKLRVRIGIHTGPAYGCLTGGRSKIKYELVGEAMEIAELMEQQATPGTVRVSRATMNLIVKKRGPLRTTLPSNKYDEEPPHEEGAEIECPSGQGLSFIARVSVGSGVSYELRRDR